MEPEEYARLHALERDHWWFRGKRAAVSALLERAGVGPVRTGERIVDVGCGTGATLDAFGPGAVAVGLDDHAEALGFARVRAGARLARADATALPLAGRSVDRVFLLDVAEHVPDDRAAFAEVRRVLRPSGVAVVHVPAHPALWSPHDAAMHHVRRYTRAGLAAALTAAGLEPVVLTWTFAGILLPAAVVRRWKARSVRDGGADFGVAPGWANRPLALWHRLEAAWLRRAGLPFGLSLGAVARPASKAP